MGPESIMVPDAPIHTENHTLQTEDLNFSAIPLEKHLSQPCELCLRV